MDLWLTAAMFVAFLFVIHPGKALNASWFVALVPYIGWIIIERWVISPKIQSK
jgi:hypothetical protein